MSVKYRNLGASGLKVSEISLGSWLTYGGYVERENAVKSIQTAYDLGVNFFDTANVYAKGEAEKVVGETLRAYPRESYVLATKVYGKIGDGPNDRGLSRKHVIESANASLKRLGLDYVDVFYSHRFDPETPIEETLRAFEDLVRQGKIHYVGVSEWTAAQITEAFAIADKYLLDRIVVNQPIYNLFDRYIEKEIIPLGSKKDLDRLSSLRLPKACLQANIQPMIKCRLSLAQPSMRTLKTELPRRSWRRLKGSKSSLPSLILRLVS